MTGRADDMRSRAPWTEALRARLAGAFAAACLLSPLAAAFPAAQEGGKDEAPGTGQGEAGTPRRREGRRRRHPRNVKTRRAPAFARLSIVSTVLALSLFALSFESLATRYERGGYYVCFDFEEAERDLNENPDDAEYLFQYAKCLLMRGDSDAEALDRLRYLGERGLVVAEYLVAEYIRTGGSLEGTDYDNIREAIEAYDGVLSLIYHHGDNYPSTRQRTHEWNYKIEPHSKSMVTYLYYEKFWHGALGTHNARFLQSPSYEGDRNLDTYPDYALYTLDSLDQTIESGNDCQSIKHYDYNDVYSEHIQEACRLYVELAQALKPLEVKRLTILEQDSCQDLNEKNCPEYYEIVDQIVDLNDQYYTFILEVKRLRNEYLAQYGELYDECQSMVAKYGHGERIDECLAKLELLRPQALEKLRAAQAERTFKRNK